MPKSRDKPPHVAPQPSKDAPFPPTKPGEAFGMLKYSGKPKTLKEMDDAIAAEVRRRHKRGEY